MSQVRRFNFFAPVLLFVLGTSSLDSAWAEDSPPFMPGWPKELGVTNYLTDGIAFADLDGDGDQEVLSGLHTAFWVWDHEGNPLPGWPVHSFGRSGVSTIGDLDGDGDLEILFTASFAGLIYIYHHDGTPFAGWPQQPGPSRTPSFYDLDEDGLPEIIFGTLDGLEVRYADGTDFPGFPLRGIGTAGGAVAVGNFVGDSRPDILFRSYVDFASTQLYAIESDGSVADGWPVTIEQSSFFAAPSLADLDGDGTLEALNMTYDRSDQIIQLNAFRGSGASVSGFPVAHHSFDTASSVVPADLDQDGDLELVYTSKVSNGCIFARDHHGNLLPGFPQNDDRNVQSSPIVANLDYGSTLEIAIATPGTLGEIYAYGSDGSKVTGFPFESSFGAGTISPAVGDIDGDGDIEIGVTGAFGRVAIWDLDAPWDRNSAAWPTYLHDNWNTSQHGFRVPDEVAGLPSPAQLGGSWATSASPNPFQGSTNIYLSNPQTEFVRVDVFDSVGRRLRSWETSLRPGEALAWDGRDRDGFELPSGQYLVRIASGDREVTQAITRIR